MADDTCCPIIDIRGKALVAAVSTLDAIGPQEKFINGNTSTFLPSHDRTAQNAIFQRSTQFGQQNTQYFGNTVKHVFRPDRMGDVLSNMYLKTQAPILPENTALSNVVITFPGEICETVPTGGSLTIQDSELQRIKLSETTLLPYTGSGTVYNDTINRFEGSNVMSNAAIGFISVNEGILGTKLIDESVVLSEDLSGPNFQVRANISTYQVVTAATESIDGGLRNFELYNLNRSSKKDLLFGTSNVTAAALFTGAPIEIDNLSLFTLGSDDYQLNMKGAAFVIDTSSYAITNGPVAYPGDYSPYQPFMITVAPEYGSKFIFSNVNVSGEDTATGTKKVEFSTNVSQNNYLTVATAGATYVANSSKLFTTAVDGVGATVSTGTVGGSGELLADNVFLESHGYGYKEGDVLTVVGGNGAGQVNWAVGDRNKSPLTQNDSLAHISIDGNQLPPGTDSKILAQVGNDFTVQYYKEGDFTQGPIGGANVISSISGYQFKSINLKLSNDFYYYTNDVNLFCNRKNLLFSIDYFSGTQSTITTLYSNINSPATDDQTAPSANKLNFYSNMQDTNITGTLTTEATYTTPPGSQLANVFMSGISYVTTDYRLDGSINPYISLEGPGGYTRITLGACQEGGGSFMVYNIQITQNLPGSDPVAISRTYDARPFTGYNDPSGAPYTGLFSFIQGEIHTTTTPFREFVDQLMTCLRIWNFRQRMFMTFDVDGGSSTPTQQIAPDQDLMNAIRYGGLKISLLNTVLVNSLTISVAYPRLDIYAGIGAQSVLGALQITDDNILLEFGGNELASTTVTITNGSNVVPINMNTSALSITPQNCSNIITGGCTYITPKNIIAPQYTAPISGGQFVNTGMGTGSGSGSVPDKRANVIITPTVYESTVFTKTSDGYANILTTLREEGPIPLQNKQMDIAFFSNTTGAYSNVVRIENDYVGITLPEANVTAQTLEDITDPYNATVEFKNSTVGNIFTYTTNNFVEYNLIVSGTYSNIGVINTLQFEKPGYDVLFDLNWQLADVGNTVSIMSHMGTYDNRTTTRYSNVLPNPNDFLKSDISKWLNPNDKNYVQMYTANNSLTYISSSNKTFPNTNAYPFSMLSVTMSTAQRLPISYDTSNAYVNKISLLPPTDLTMATGNLNAWFNTTYEIYSGPTALSIHTDSIKSLMNNTSYSTNVAYTRGRLTANINVAVGGTISTTFPTYSTNATIEFNTFANTMTLGTNSYAIPNTLNSYYDKFLRSNTLLYNSLIDLGELAGSGTTVPVTAGISQASFTYNTGGSATGSHIYLLGKSSPTAECYRVSADTSPAGAPEVIKLIDFDFAFSGGGACLDTTNFYVYLFAPNNGNSLYRVKFNTSLRIFEGAWTLESTGFPWTSVENAGISYYNKRLYSLTGYIPSHGLGAYNYINYYDIPTGVWGVINVSYGMSRVLAPQLEAGGNIYFGGYKTSGGLATSTKVDTWYKFMPATSAVVEMTATNLILDTSYSAMTNYGSSPVTDIFITDFQSLGSSVFKIDIALDTVSNVVVGVNAGSPLSIQSVSNIYGPSLASDYQSSQMVMYGGQDILVGGLTANVFTMDMSLTIPLVTDPAKIMDITPNDGYYNASFVGPAGPGNVPLVKSGIRLAQERVPIFTVEDSSTPANYLEFGLKRSNVVTAVQGSSRTNKGIFENWYINTKDTDNLIINTGWEGTDSLNNYSQANVLLGPVWAGDALNTNDAIANFYASNIIFQSTVNAAYSNIVFETGNVSAAGDPRNNLVPNQIANSSVEYSTMPYMANNFFNYTVDGTVPYTSSADSSVTITNKFNPFVKSTFESYPTVTACYDTDNIPTLDWEFNYLAANNAIAPPYANAVSNVLVNDLYRQYLPSKITRSGRLDKVAFTYGASRWALPSGGTQQDATQQYGVFRDKIYPNPASTGSQYLEIGARKLTLCSFSSDTLQTSNSQVEIYKYFASNVGASSNLTTTERGWEDEIIVAFGSQTTASGNKEYVKIKPGYGTDLVVVPSSGVPPTNAVMPDDSVVVTFSDYNLQDLSVNVGVIYSSSVVSRYVTPTSPYVDTPDAGTIIKLSSATFNTLYDSQAKSGNMIITSTHNSGIVTSNTSFGERPVANVFAQNDVLFSQNLWSTCLSEWSQLPGTVGDPSRDYAQENVYEEVFPVNISIQKYSPNGIYANKLGRAIIKHVKFSIGGTTIQDLDDLWYITNDELLRSQDEKDSLKYLINGGEDYLPTSPSNYGPIDLYIPLDLFFCRTRKTSSTLITPVKVFDEYRSWKPYLPLCAMGSQDFEIEIEFYPQQYFSNTGGTINLPSVKTSIITEEILISPAERNYLKRQPQEFLVETATKFPEQIFSMTQPEIDQRFEGFVANYPVKMTNWLFRSTQFEDENDSTYFLHRYNFSTVVSTNDEYRLFFEFMKKADFFIEGVPQIERFGITDYYKYVNALAGGLSSTKKNIYSYLFSMDPAKYGPSGSLNFSETNSNKTFLSFKIAPQTQSSAIEKVDTSLGATLHGWAYGFNVLKIEEGRAFKPFS